MEGEDFKEVVGILLLLLLLLMLLLLALFLLLLFFFSAALRWGICLGDVLKLFTAMAIVLVDVKSMVNLFFYLSVCGAKA